MNNGRYEDSMKVCVVGLGYIGLPTAVILASHGCEVIGVDISYFVVDNLKQGKVVIEEPNLEFITKECVMKGMLRPKLEPEIADAFIIAVPTLFQGEDKSCDLTYVLNALESILPYLRKGNTVIIESTIAPLSTEESILPILEKQGFKIGINLYLAHCPERVLPGRILYELENNDRIIGGITRECAEHAAKVYRTFVRGKLILTNARTAELSKCMENTFRDVNIALSNELAKICNELHIDCMQVIRMVNRHPRVQMLTPGPGVGGHCLAIDPYFICSKAKDTSRLISLAREINTSMPEYVETQVRALLPVASKIAVFGLSYKGNIDDTRESPALEVVNRLREGYELMIYDPHVHGYKTTSMEEAVRGADMILVLSDHKEFATLDHKQLVEWMNHPVLFDTRNFIQPQLGSGLTVINFGNVFQYVKK